MRSPVLPGPTVTIAPMNVSVRMMEPALPWTVPACVDLAGRGRCVPTPVHQEPLEVAAVRSANVTMERVVIMSRESVIALLDIRDTW